MDTSPGWEQKVKLRARTNKESQSSRSKKKRQLSSSQKDFLLASWPTCGTAGTWSSSRSQTIGTSRAFLTVVFQRWVMNLTTSSTGISSENKYLKRSKEKRLKRRNKSYFRTRTPRPRSPTNATSTLLNNVPFSTNKRKKRSKQQSKREDSACRNSKKRKVPSAQWRNSSRPRRRSETRS